jgi:hypothetical protein
MVHGNAVKIVIVTMATNHSTSFDDVKSRQALADNLNCDVKALDDVMRENARLKLVLEETKRKLESSGEFLSFDSLRAGGVLSKYVEDFTFFASVETNESFLEMINFADGSPGACDIGDGLCEKLASNRNPAFPKSTTILLRPQMPIW